MKRKVLFIDKEELHSHFEKNRRQDVKIVTPAILTDQLAEKLRERGKDVKQEEHLKGNQWTHSPSDQPNKICEAMDFDEQTSMPTGSKGPLSVSFANSESDESMHYHNHHWEIYYSEHRLETKYKLSPNSIPKTKILKHGGAILFAPGVHHEMKIGGLTIVIETPAVIGDREEAK